LIRWRREVSSSSRSHCCCSLWQCCYTPRIDITKRHLMRTRCLPWWEICPSQPRGRQQQGGNVFHSCFSFSGGYICSREDEWSGPLWTNQCCFFLAEHQQGQTEKTTQAQTITGAIVDVSSEAI
jgi:hypothetical protein